jgi:hypothetical protein
MGGARRVLWQSLPYRDNILLRRGRLRLQIARHIEPPQGPLATKTMVRRTFFLWEGIARPLHQFPDLSTEEGEDSCERSLWTIWTNWSKELM